MRINTFTLLRMYCTLYCILFTLACIPSSMNPKRPASLLPSTSRFKRQRKAVALKVKLDIIKRHERGEGTPEIGRAHAIAASTVHSIVQSSAKIKKISQIATSSSATTLTRMRDGAMHNMEHLLCVWIEDQTKRRIPLSLAVIQEKARSLWNNLKKKQEAEGKGEGAETFTAS